MKRLLSIALVLLVACGSSLSDYDYTHEPDPRAEELVLGVGDVVQVNIWGNENKELNTEAKIRPDGTITMPLVGDIRAAGQTPTQLKAKIKDMVGTYIKLGAGTEITVAVKSWNSYRFTISGEVVKQCVCSSDQYLRVSEALALAGGLSRFARRNEMSLTRKDAKTGKIKHIPLDYDELASGKRRDMDIYILPGDELYVP